MAQSMQKLMKAFNDGFSALDKAKQDEQDVDSSEKKGPALSTLVKEASLAKKQKGVALA